MLRRRNGARSPDGGFTLIELTIAAGLTVLVVTIVGGIFLSMSRASTQVGSMTTATTAGQLVSTSIGRGVRNSSGIATTTVGGDLLLRARTASSGSTLGWRCAAWYYSSTDKTIRYKTSASAIAVPASTSAQTSWTSLAHGVTSTAFTVTPNGRGSQTLSFSFRVAAGTGSPIVIDDAASTQPVQTGDPTCF